MAGVFRRTWYRRFKRRSKFIWSKSTTQITILIGKVTETDEARTFPIQTQVRITETGRFVTQSYPALDERGNVFILGGVTERGERVVGGQSAPGVLTVAIGQAIETDVARSFLRIDKADDEVDIANVISPAHSITIGKVTATETARTVSPAHFTGIGKAFETDLAGDFGIPNHIFGVIEVDVALPITPVKPAPTKAFAKGSDMSLTGARGSEAPAKVARGSDV